MAKQTILTERGTGEVMYPQTLASLVSTAGGGTVDEAIDQAKLAVFVDQWNTACSYGWETCKFGKYDHENAPDADHPFLLNGIWLTYGEAVTALMYHSQRILAPLAYVYSGMPLRTFIPPMTTGSAGSMHHWCANGINLEKVVFRRDISSDDMSEAFAGCQRLRVIEGKLIVPFASLHAAFGYCYALEEVRLHRIGNSVSFADSPKLSYASLSYLVGYADNGTKVITVTVHPDVYAKLTDEANTEWHQVLLDAAEKNIVFATTT